MRYAHMAKAIWGIAIGGGLAFFGALITATADGSSISLNEWFTAVSAALIAAGGVGAGVYGITNAPNPPRSPMAPGPAPIPWRSADAPAPADMQPRA